MIKKIMFSSFMLTLMTLFSFSSYAENTKICFGSGNVKGQRFLMTASKTNLEISDWQSPSEKWEDSSYVSRGHVVKSRDGHLYIEFYVDAVDGGVATIQVDEALLLPETKGLVKMGWKYQVSSYFCRDERK